MARRDPIEHRRDQIDREISKLQNPKNVKKRSDFKSEEAFENWQFTRSEKVRELHEELATIDYPAEYYNVPIAIAAAELGLTLDEIHEVIREKLIPLSSTGISNAADRISRDELGKALDIGSDNLLHHARLEIPELFLEAIDALGNRDIDLAKIIYDRIEKHDSCINPYALACEIGIQFVSKNVSELESSFKFILGRDNTESLSAILTTREVLSKLHSDSDVLECMREQFLAIADGQKESPFQETYSQYQATTFQSQRSDEQNLAILIGDVVMDAIERYKFVKSITSSRGYTNDDREVEILRVIQNAAYTALEAHKNYNESPSSKIFVDRYIGLKTKRRHAPVLLELLPKIKKAEKITPQS